MARSRTIILSVSRKTGDVFDAILESPPKMMSDAKKNLDGSWSFSTPRGMANLKFNHNKKLGILDHLYVDEETSWEVPMRVVASGNESEVLITLVKPDILTNEQFDERMKEIKILFDNLKKIIEAS